MTAAKAGVDGNLLAMYAVWKNEQLRTVADTTQFSGGSSNGTLRVTLDFAALGIPEVRVMWLTLAPPLSNGAAFVSTEWEALFTNWTLSGPETKKMLQVAGPASVRVEENDAWCAYTGNWSIESGFFSDGFAKRASVVGDTVTVKYVCSSVHDLYLGTSLYTDRSSVGVKLNGDAETDFNCLLQNDPSVNTCRKLRTGIAAGEHVVTIRVKTAGPFYFDYLEAVVATDIPAPRTQRTNVSPALDYSTDHSYKLPPGRILWMLDQLGFTGAMNEYIGVFWWNQRKREGQQFRRKDVCGNYAANDQIFLTIGGQECGKTVFPNETNAMFARHFAQF
ncbi:MAG: hypothetical protein WKF37_03275 [Bryobacteraceae bacterium]